MLMAFSRFAANNPLFNAFLDAFLNAFSQSGFPAYFPAVFSQHVCTMVMTFS